MTTQKDFALLRYSASNTTWQLIDESDHPSRLEILAKLWAQMQPKTEFRLVSRLDHPTGWPPHYETFLRQSVDVYNQALRAMLGAVVARASEDGARVTINGETIQ